MILLNYFAIGSQVSNRMISMVYYSLMLPI